MIEGATELPLSEPSVHTEDATPLASKSSSSTTSTLSLGRDDFTQTSPPGSFVIKCPCGSNKDDEVTVQCEKCSVWHHARCVGLDQGSPPEVYHCRDCREQEDTIDVVMNEPPPLAQETSISTATTNTVPKSPKKKRGGARKALPAPSRSSSPVTITMTEISENIVDNRVLYLIDALKQELLKKPFATKTSDAAAPYRRKNFEFSDTIRMEYMQDLETALKPVEVKEVVYGRDTRFAVYATEAIDPGLLVSEFMGQIRSVDSLLPESKKGTWVSQTFVLFPNAPRDDAWWETDEDLTLLAIDARKLGSLSRYVRRSCRPNLTVKVVCVGVGESASIHFVLASSNVIAAGEELCLPLDFGDPYNDGLFYYDCACSQPELCLSPYARRSRAPPPAKKLHTNFKTSAESNKSAASSSTASDAAAASRKLTREERKMQRYIEFFDKMDRIEHKKETRRSGENSVGSKNRRASAPADGNSDTESSTPPPPKRRSLALKKGSSPVTRSVPQSPLKEPFNPKKAWLKAAQQSLSQPHTPIVHDTDDLIDVVGEASTTPVAPKTRKVTQKRKPKPEPPPIQPIKSPEEPGEIIVASPPVMTRPVFEDLPVQSPPHIFPQRRGFEPPAHLEDRYARINRPTLIDDRHPRAFTSPERRPPNFPEEMRSRRGEEQGFEQQRPDRRSFEQHRKFYDEPPHFPRPASTTGTSSNVSSPREYTSRDTYSHQQRGEHRFPPPRDRIPQQQHQHQGRPFYPHQDAQRRRMFSRDEEMVVGRGREYDEPLPHHHRTRPDDRSREHSPSQRPFDAFAGRRSPPYRPRTSFPPEDFHRSERNTRFTNEMPSGLGPHEEHFRSESPHTGHPRPSTTRDFDRHAFNGGPSNNNTQRQ